MVGDSRPVNLNDPPHFSSKAQPRTSGALLWPLATAAIASAAADGSRGMIGASDGVVVARRKEIAESAIKHRLPTIFAFRPNVEADVWFR